MTDDTDALVARARDAASYPLIGRGSRGRHIQSTLLVCAAAIERLQAELGELRDAHDEAAVERDAAGYLGSVASCVKDLSSRCDTLQRALAAAEAEIERMRGTLEDIAAARPMFEGGVRPPSRAALGALIVDIQSMASTAISAPVGEVEPKRCYYVFNGCAHPEHCKDGCAALTPAPVERAGENVERAAPQSCPVKPDR